MDQIPKTQTRRALLFGSGALAIAGATYGSAWGGQRRDAPIAGVAGGFVERFILRGGHRIRVREFPGAGPTFVMLHGFPDNLHIYDDLAPLLAAAGRHVVMFDFLGFGESDKPVGFAYSFEQQLADLAAVIDAAAKGPVVLVAHDAGGPSAINYALRNPSRIASLTLLNTFYADAPTLRFPELIELFSEPDLKALAGAIAADPSKMQWLLGFQNEHFLATATQAQRERFNTVLQPIINANFADKPGAGPAFMAMTGDLRANVAFNGTHFAAMKSFPSPVKLVWGMGDPYLNKGVAEDLAGHFGKATLMPLEAGHWPQIDVPDQVARAILLGTLGTP